MFIVELKQSDGTWIELDRTEGYAGQTKNSLRITAEVAKTQYQSHIRGGEIRARDLNDKKE